MAEFLNQKLEILFTQKEVDFAYLGGSWAQNKQNWWSDIDLFISVPSYINLSSNLQFDFLTSLHIKALNLTNFDELEILVLETLPLHVQFNVISNGILIYEKNPNICSLYIEKLLPLYYDHMIWYKKFLKESEYI